MKEGATVPQSKGTVMNNASGFKNGVKIATAAEMAVDDDEEEEDDDEDQDWKLDTSDAAVAERRLKELDLITRVEKIMNAGLGDKAKGTYKWIWQCLPGHVFLFLKKVESPTMLIPLRLLFFLRSLQNL